MAIRPSPPGGSSFASKFATSGTSGGFVDHVGTENDGKLLAWEVAPVEPAKGEPSRVEAIFGGALRDEVERRLVVVGEKNSTASGQCCQARQAQPATDLECVEVEGPVPGPRSGQGSRITTSARRYAPGQRYAQ